MHLPSVFPSKKVEIMPTAEDKIPMKKMEIKTVKRKCSVFICGIISKFFAQIINTSSVNLRQPKQFQNISAHFTGQKFIHGNKNSQIVLSNAYSFDK